MSCGRGWSSAGRGGTVAPWRKVILLSFLTTPKTSEPPPESPKCADKGNFKGVSFLPVSTHFFGCVKSLTPPPPPPVPITKEPGIGERPSSVLSMPLPPPSGLILQPSSHAQVSLLPT